MSFRKTQRKKYALFKGDIMVGGYVFSDIESAKKEQKEWNKQMKDYNESIKKLGLKREPQQMVTIKEYKQKRRTTEQKFKEMFG